MSNIVTQLQSSLYESFINKVKNDFDNGVFSTLKDIRPEKEVFNKITSPLIDKLGNLSNEKVIDYLNFLGDARNYLYETYFPKKDESYFTIMADPPVKAYDYCGQNSLEVVEDDTLYARMEGY